MKTTMKPTKLGDRIIGKCADCGGPFPLEEEYILRNAVWLQAARKDERLHRACFERRLGRPLTDDDYLARYRAEGNEVKGEVLDLPAYWEEWGHLFKPDTAKERARKRKKQRRRLARAAR
jgi:hypothetical protein